MQCCVRGSWISRIPYAVFGTLFATLVVNCGDDPEAKASAIEFTISGLLEGADMGTSGFVRPNREYVGDADQNAFMSSAPGPDGVVTPQLVGDDSLSYRQANTHANAIRLSLPSVAVGSYVFAATPSAAEENDSMWVRVETNTGNSYRAGADAEPYGSANDHAFGVNITESGDNWVKGSFSFAPYVYNLDGFNQEHSDLVSINGEFDVFHLK